MPFKLETFLNPHLPKGKTTLETVFSVAAEGDAAVAAAPVVQQERVIGLLGDISGSMRGSKIEAMKHGMRVGVDQLDEKTHAFVVVFDEEAIIVIEPILADAEGKKLLHAAIQRIETRERGTRFSRGLHALRSIFAKFPGAICIGYMLTDGKNEGEQNSALEAELKLCEGLFQLHSRGVGTDYTVQELRRISDKLLGTLNGISNHASLAEDFKATLQEAMSKTVSDLKLRLWMPKVTKVKAIEQSFPVKRDMTDKVVRVNDRVIEISLGAFGDASQDYSISFDLVPNQPSNDPTLICRASLVFVDPATGAEAVVDVPPVTAWWTEDDSLSSRISPEVAHYQEEGEKKIALQEGVDALQNRDDDVATVRLGHALKLAQASGDEQTIRLIKNVAEVQNDGTIRVKRDRSKAAVMDLDIASARTVRASRN